MFVVVSKYALAVEELSSLRGMMYCQQCRGDDGQGCIALVVDCLDFPLVEREGLDRNRTGWHSVRA